MIKANWKKLVLANYTVDSSVLDQYLPAHTEYDRWQGECYVSLVAFLFLDTRVLGIPFPFHTNFEEVNLRFYVRHREKDIWKRGVVFIKEIVPAPLVTFVANTLYKEHYQTMPMKHFLSESADQIMVEYQWKKNTWNTLKIISAPIPVKMNESSIEYFFTDQHWGYTKASDKLTLVYEVPHPRWTYYSTKEYHIDADFGNLYGDAFSFLTHQTPSSVFLTEGSVISLKKNSKLISQ